MTRLEFIELNQDFKTSIEYQQAHPILKSLYLYYKDLFCCEPVLMVTDVFNSAQYIKIVPSNEFMEAIDCYLDGDVNEEQKEITIELINFNSKMLKDILN